MAKPSDITRARQLAMDVVDGDVISRKPPCEHCGSTRRHRLGCPRSTAPPSTSEVAARWLHDHGGTVVAAAEAHGVTYQAVQQMWDKLFPGEPIPSERARVERNAKISALAEAGKSAREIADDLGLTASTVSTALRALGIVAAPSGSDALDAAVQAVVAGEHPVDAAIDAGVSYSGLRARLDGLGIATRSDSLRTLPDRKDGRIARAVVRVTEGHETVPQAAATERCAPSSVYAALRRLRRDTA